MRNKITDLLQIRHKPKCKPTFDLSMTHGIIATSYSYDVRNDIRETDSSIHFDEGVFLSLGLKTTMLSLKALICSIYVRLGRQMSKQVKELPKLLKVREGERRAYNCRPLQSWWALADRVWSGTFVDTSPAPLCITKEIEFKNESLEKNPKTTATAQALHHGTLYSSNTFSHNDTASSRDLQHAPRKSAVHRAPRNATPKGY